jgi:hypothetical protein
VRLVRHLCRTKLRWLVEVQDWEFFSACAYFDLTGVAHLEAHNLNEGVVFPELGVDAGVDPFWVHVYSGWVSTTLLIE